MKKETQLQVVTKQCIVYRDTRGSLLEKCLSVFHILRLEKFFKFQLDDF